MPTQPNDGDAAGVRGPRIGVWGVGDLDDAAAVVSPRVLEAELRRRVPDLTVHHWAPFGRLRPRPRDGGRPVEPLGPASDKRLAELACAVDLVVVAGPRCLLGDEPLAADYGLPPEQVAALRLDRYFLDGPPVAGDGLPLVAWHCVEVASGVWPDARLSGAAGRLARISVADPASRRVLAVAKVEAEVAVVPDSALLLPRLVSAEVLGRRADQLAAVADLPADARLVVVDADLLMTDYGPPVLAEVAHQQAVDAATQLVVADVGGRAVPTTLPVTHVWLGAAAGIEDLAAAVAGACAVVTGSRFLAAAAVGFGVPLAAVDADGVVGDLVGEDGAMVVRRPEDVGPALVRLMASADRRPRTAAALVARLDAEFDALAALAETAARRRGGEEARGAASGAAASPLAELERALAYRDRRLLDERAAFVAEITVLEEELRRQKLEHAVTVARLCRELALWRAAAERVMGSKTWRWTEGARRVYRRLRAQA